VATIEEIKEDFFYLYVVELALLLAVISNFIYYGQWITTLTYVLLFWAIFISEDKILKAILLSRTKSLKEIFNLLSIWKKLGKAAMAFYLSVLILFSSWGVIAYLSQYVGHADDVIRAVTPILPIYIAIYAAWLVYLSIMKNKYTKLVLSLLQEKSPKFKIHHIFLVHKKGNLIAVVSLKPLGDKERTKIKNEILKRSQDFHWKNMNVAIEREKDLKLALIYTGKIPQTTRAKMKSLLKKLLIVYPSLKEGKVEKHEIEFLEEDIKRDLI